MDISQLAILHPEVLLGIKDVFPLLLDNLVMLVADEFLLFFEVGDDLLHRLLQDLDFALVY